MTTISFKKTPVEIHGTLPSVGQAAPEFTLVQSDLSELTLAGLKGKKVLMNIFPSIDTPVCALQLKKFSQMASEIDNTVILFCSLDLPFAFSRFCGAEGIRNAVTASDYRHHSLAESYGVKMLDGPLSGLYARAVLVLDETHTITYSELVQEVTDEPDYDAALNTLTQISS